LQPPNINSFEPGRPIGQIPLLVIGGADMARFDNKVVLVSGGARGQALIRIPVALIARGLLAVTVSHCSKRI
jgi:hypothetical protein